MKQILITTPSVPVIMPTDVKNNQILAIDTSGTTQRRSIFFQPNVTIRTVFALREDGSIYNTGHPTLSSAAQHMKDFTHNKGPFIFDNMREATKWLFNH